MTAEKSNKPLYERSTGRGIAIIFGSIASVLVAGTVMNEVFGPVPLPIGAQSGDPVPMVAAAIVVVFGSIGMALGIMEMAQ